jgi:hypothetical protein
MASLWTGWNTSPQSSTKGAQARASRASLGRATRRSTPRAWRKAGRETEDPILLWRGSAGDGDRAPDSGYRSTSWRIQTAPSFSVMGTKSRRAVTAIVVCRRSGDSISPGLWNDVTWKALATAVPESGSNRRPQMLSTPPRLDMKYSARPPGAHRGLSSKESPAVIGVQTPPVAGTT